MLNHSWIIVFSPNAVSPFIDTWINSLNPLRALNSTFRSSHASLSAAAAEEFQVVLTSQTCNIWQADIK